MADRLDRAIDVHTGQFHAALSRSAHVIGGIRNSTFAART
jgi:hypothetical protein